MNLNFLGQAAHGTTTTASLLGLLGAAWVLSAMACGADTDTRLGAAGEECFDDFDCREPLVCLEATCAVEGSNSGTTSNNISTSNATNNSTSSNTSTNNGDIPVDREEGCVLVCDRLVECFLEGGSIDECSIDCIDTVQGWTSDEYNTFIDCTLNRFTCIEIQEGALDACIP